VDFHAQDPDAGADQNQDADGGQRVNPRHDTGTNLYRWRLRSD
jgi:hypothetical protein